MKGMTLYGLQDMGGERVLEKEAGLRWWRDSGAKQPGGA